MLGTKHFFLSARIYLFAISHTQPQLKPNQAEGDLSSPNAPNAVPKVPKGKDEYSGHLPQVYVVLYTGTT